MDPLTLNPLYLINGKPRITMKSSEIYVVLIFDTFIPSLFYNLH